MRREFKMPDSDQRFLDERGRPWEAIVDGVGRWILLHEFPVPAGYGHREVSAAFRIEPAYPDAQIDMVYFNPHLSRTDGGVIGGLTSQPIDGAAWQRWSRHRTSSNPWRPGIDDLAAHVALVGYWLEREFVRLN